MHSLGTDDLRTEDVIYFMHSLGTGDVITYVKKVFLETLSLTPEVSVRSMLATYTIGFNRIYKEQDKCERFDQTLSRHLRLRVLP